MNVMLSPQNRLPTMQNRPFFWAVTGRLNGGRAVKGFLPVLHMVSFYSNARSSEARTSEAKILSSNTSVYSGSLFQGHCFKHTRERYQTMNDVVSVQNKSIVHSGGGLSRKK